MTNDSNVAFADVPAAKPKAAHSSDKIQPGKEEVRFKVRSLRTQESFRTAISMPTSP